MHGLILMTIFTRSFYAFGAEIMYVLMHYAYMSSSLSHCQQLVVMEHLHLGQHLWEIIPELALVWIRLM